MELRSSFSTSAFSKFSLIFVRAEAMVGGTQTKPAPWHLAGLVADSCQGVSMLIFDWLSAKIGPEPPSKAEAMEMETSFHIWTISPLSSLVIRLH